MAALQECFEKKEQLQKEKRDLMRSYRDALETVPGYKDLSDEIKILRQKRKQIEDEVRLDFSSEFERIEDIKIDLDAENELLSDMALNQYVKGEHVSVKDGYDNEYEPFFTVKFKKK